MCALIASGMVDTEIEHLIMEHQFVDASMGTAFAMDSHLRSEQHSWQRSCRESENRIRLRDIAGSPLETLRLYKYCLRALISLIST